MRKMAIALSIVAAMAPSLARAEQHCMARVLQDVGAQEAPEEVMSKAGGLFGPVKHIKVSKKTGRMYLCGEHSYCYDSNAFEFATPCRIKLDKDVQTPGYFAYFTR